ncbi:MAG: ABC transporter ATP-binding protein [Bdellovibrio sp.]|nr:ABC transporter ATP-binding protein [Bdellovibrio sp.]
MAIALQLTQIKFSYGETPVLDIPQMQVEKGEVVFLFGPSGSGKSTLLELFAGILKPQAGDLIVEGQNLAKMNLSELDHFRAENIGYIFQSFNLIPYLSVIENIKLPFLFQKNAVDENELNDLIDRLGLKNFVHRPVSQLSVGQQQRVAVARALLKKPQVILADEPTSALDYDHRENFLKILFKLCREHKITVLFVSHDRSIEKLFDRAIHLPEINHAISQSAEVL